MCNSHARQPVQTCAFAHAHAFGRDGRAGEGKPPLTGRPPPHQWLQGSSVRSVPQRVQKSSPRVYSLGGGEGGGGWHKSYAHCQFAAPLSAQIAEWQCALCNKSAIPLLLHKSYAHRHSAICAESGVAMCIRFMQQKGLMVWAQRVKPPTAALLARGGRRITPRHPACEAQKRSLRASLPPEAHLWPPPPPDVTPRVGGA